MKIALIIQNGDRRRGGAEQYTLDLARSLAARGHAVTVVAEKGPQEVAESAAAAGFKCVYLGAKGALRWPRLQDFLKRVKALYEGGAYEVVHAMLPVWRCDVYQPHSGLAAELVAAGHMKHPGRVVQQFSRVANHMNLKRVGLARLEEQMMRPVDGAVPWILCSSSQMEAFARRQFPGVPDSHLVSMMNGIDLAYFDPAHGAGSRQAIREEWGIEKGQRLGVLVGNNWKLKGVREAIEALALANDPRLVVMIVGREEAAGYQKLAGRLGVGERVKFVGRVGDLRTVYGAADFMLLPTRRDTCSLVVLEGLAMGLPVITTAAERRQRCD